MTSRQDYMKEYRQAHREQLRAYNRAWYHRNRDAAQERAAHLRTRYGMTEADYNDLLAKQGGCAICGTQDPRTRSGRFHIDHDHATGKRRGLLCHPCNSALGLFKDDLQRLAAAIAYLEQK